MPTRATPQPATLLPRLFVGGTTLIATSLAGGVFADVLRSDGVGILDAILLPLFLLLFAWVAQGFFTAVLGFVLVMRQPRLKNEEGGANNETAQASAPSSFAVSPSSAPSSDHAPLPRTAIVMPIYNEDPARVLSGLRAIYDSLQATGYGDAFDLFIMSDTNDPERWLAEEAAWASLCLETCTGKGSQIFYRRRPYNTARKSGNIADFCVRWGRLYEYMVVLDADSLMEGDTLVEMVRRMTANQRLGILQAPPVPINRDSLFARMMQFAASMYSPIFNTGFAAWTGYDGNYYGHNAIMRTQAFMEHCGLPHLPGEAPLGGEILSHDFVEAAMMRRNGWDVRIDPDLAGSYEEMPTTLIDYAKRDRRWCQGNLQHVRIGLARNMHAVSRLHLLMGAMAYCSSPLWLIFMVLMAVAYVFSDGVTRGSFDGRFTAFEALGLFLVVMAMLVTPKLLAFVAALRDRERLARFGGPGRALLGIVSETALSVLLAPIMMAFHSRFVYETLTGMVVAWVTQNRDESHTTLKEAWLTHQSQVIAGVVAGVAAWFVSPSMFLWLLPVTVGLVMSPVFSSLTSRVDIGHAARRLRLFLIPAETDPPTVLLRMHQHVADLETKPAEDDAGVPGADRFTRAILDPTFNTLHVSLLRAYGAYVRETPQLAAARHKALEQGPQALTKQEKMAILSHEDTVRWLHGAAWQRWPVG